MLNIAEGFARKTDKEFKQFLTYAHGSCAEVQSGLYVALDQKYISQEQFDMLYSKTEEVSKMIMNFSRYLSTDTKK
jgi:four helix bundle protein